tara:strand:- start:15040 stop:16560 length:1521 start_codon:yes stop_codon:yes gene_type:complete
VFVQAREDALAFTKLYGDMCGDRQVDFVTPENMQKLAEAGCLFYPGPGVDELTSQRQIFGNKLWSVCGITHTTASDRAMSAIVNMLTTPVEPWDALICPSNAVKGHAEVMLEEQSSFLAERLGSVKVTYPEMPVIPLGIHTEDFSYTGDKKRAARSALGINDEEIVVLYTGRLSFHAKAHPLAMYQALENAVSVSKREVVLIESGWHGNEHIEAAFQEGAKVVCPNIRVIRLDGRDVIQRNQGWASADIFCSLVDNIQETFGIVPIEAMAAGLPVVVSDWDGYRDSVRDEVDGYRIPTTMPEAGLGQDLAYRHAVGIDSYDRYCGNTSSLVSVDIEAAAGAFVKLFNSPELRDQMGASGRKRAKEHYDWEIIIPKYEELWDRLKNIRQSKPSKNRGPQKHPARLDPFYAFSGYPTRQLSPKTLLGLRLENAPATLSQLEKVGGLAMVNFAAYVIPTKEEAEIIINNLEAQPKSAEQILEFIPERRRPYVSRSLVWMLKMGLLRELR